MTDIQPLKALRIFTPAKFHTVDRRLLDSAQKRGLSLSITVFDTTDLMRECIVIRCYTPLKGKSAACFVSITTIDRESTATGKATGGSAYECYAFQDAIWNLGFRLNDDFERLANHNAVKAGAQALADALGIKGAFLVVSHP